MVLELHLMPVLYILEPCVEYQWKELKKTIPTIANIQNRQISTYRVLEISVTQLSF